MNKNTTATAEARGFEAGVDAALQVPESKLTEYAAQPEAWIEEAIEAAVNSGYEGPDAPGVEAFLTAFMSAAEAKIAERVGK